MIILFVSRGAVVEDAAEAVGEVGFGVAYGLALDAGVAPVVHDAAEGAEQLGHVDVLAAADALEPYCAGFELLL